MNGPVSGVFFADHSNGKPERSVDFCFCASAGRASAVQRANKNTVDRAARTLVFMVLRLRSRRLDSTEKPVLFLLLPVTDMTADAPCAGGDEFAKQLCGGAGGDAFRLGERVRS